MKKLNKKGQFTKEVFKTKTKWWWRGFNSINWVIAIGAFVFGVAFGMSV